MAFSGLFSNATGAKKLCKLEIRPDNDFVFLRGAIGETTDFAIKGHVVLMTSETIQTRGVKVLLQGKRRTMHFSITNEREKLQGAAGSTHIVNKSTFFSQEVKLEHSGTFKGGNHELPFEFSIPGDTSESVEGLPGNFVVYELKAVADRGIMAKDLTARRNLRIIRMPREDSMELLDPQVIDGTWPDKLRYTLNAPSKAVIFGDKIVTDIELTPLLEKLRIGPIRVSLLETRKIKTVPGPIETREGSSGMWRTENEVAHMTMDVPEACQDTNEQLQLPMYKFRSTLPLPRSLTKCRQSIEKNEWIRVKHQIHFEIILHNPDGHISQLKAHHAVRLFISPNLPIGENNEVSGVSCSDTNGSLLGELQAAPPNYGSHQLDPLYQDVETELGGYQTPFSGAATPRFTPSRRGSGENVAVTPNEPYQIPRELNARLKAIAENSQPTSASESQTMDASSPGTSQRPSPGASRTNSVFDASAISQLRNVAAAGERDSRENSAFNMDELIRLPSFNTAQHAPLPRRHESDAPPTYEATISQPPSPSREQSFGQ